jgi:hypothetical protein
MRMSSRRRKMDWLHCEANWSASPQLVHVGSNLRRELCDTSGTIEPFPHAIAE